MEKQIEFKVGSETLRGKLYIPEGKGPFPGVVFFQGSAGAGELYFFIAEKLYKSGFVCLAFNYRGVGLSEGKFGNQTIGDSVEDAKAAYAFLISQPEVDKSRVGMMGGSHGGFLTSLLSNELKPRSIIVAAASAYAPDRMSDHRDSGSQRDNFSESNSYKEIARYKGKLLVIKYELDDEILPGMVEEYFKNSHAPNKQWYVLKGAKHRVSKDPIRREALTERVISWFKETL